MTRVRRTVPHWLPLGEPVADGPRLFCFPHAGGGAAAYAAWRAPGWTVCPVQPPGRGERHQHQLHHDVESCVDDLLASVGHLFTGHYALFGHSVGALVAYRLACRLTGENAPAHLFVSGRAAPQLPYARPRLHALPVRELVPHLRALGGTPDAVLADPGLLELFLPPLRADFAMNETYRHEPGAPLTIPVTAFGGETDPRADLAELRAWRALTTGRFETHRYPGGHFYLERHATGVLDVISRSLEHNTRS